MVPYLLSAAYYLKLTLKEQERWRKGDSGSLKAARLFALVGTLYGMWMLYAGGLDYVLITTVLYAPGMVVYYLGKKERGEMVFRRPFEAALATALALAALVSLFLIGTGRIKPF